MNDSSVPMLERQQGDPSPTHGATCDSFGMPHRGARTASFESRASQASMRSLQVPDLSVLSCPVRTRKILIAFLLWLPWQIFVTALFFISWFLIQTVLLPCRCCGRRCVTMVKRCFAARFYSAVVCLFVTTNTCETCYGRDCRGLASYDDFLQSCSASRRKNIRRNFKSAQRALRAKGIIVEYFSAGDWQITAELRALIWDQCNRHSARSFGYADILNCGSPVPPLIMYVGELMLMMAFPCDIQLFKDPSNNVVSLNTRVHAGNNYFNPNYATKEEYSREGIYPAFNWHMLHEALRLHASIMNVMPSLRSAKGALGLRPLHLRSLVAASFSCVRRRPRSVAMTVLSLVSEENDMENVTAPPEQGAKGGKSHPAPKGGKRAARKKAAAEQAALEAGGSFPVEVAKHAQENKAEEVKLTISDSSSLPDAKSKAAPKPKGGKRAARKKADAEKEKVEGMKEGDNATTDEIISNVDRAEVETVSTAGPSQSAISLPEVGLGGSEASSSHSDSNAIPLQAVVAPAAS